VGDAEKEAIMSARGRSAPASGDKPSLRPAIVLGVIVGVVQVASPFAFWWLDAATVYALGLAAIAFVYIGFAVADGRSKVIGIEATVAMVFVVAAAIGITGSAWLLVVGFAGHGLKDAWQHRTRVRVEHAVVASILRGGRLGRSSRHRDRHRGRGEPPEVVVLVTRLRCALPSTPRHRQPIRGEPTRGSTATRGQGSRSQARA